MKENSNIDELLNGFIDGELTQRQLTEVQRLVSHDARVVERLRELQRCKILVSSLPSNEAPDEILEQIRASLERKTLLGQQPEHSEQRQGARHLLVRKVLAAAAMIGLIAVLAAVVYTIVAPESVSKHPVAVERRQPPAKKIEPEKPGLDVVATVEKPATEITLAATGFNGKLELTTKNPIVVDAFISRVIGDNGLLGKVSITSQDDQSFYTLSCSRQELGMLLADLENGWDKFDSATLFVETKELGRQVVVNKVTTEQIAEIADQDNPESSVKAAKYFAVLNNMDELLPGKEILTAVDDRKPKSIAIPKPVLTSDEKTIKKPPAEVKDGQNVYLTIVVTGNK